MTSRGPCFEAFELIFFFSLVQWCIHIPLSAHKWPVWCFMSGEQPDNTGPPQRGCEPFWPRSVLNKEPRETHTHKEIYKEWKQQLVIPLQYRPPTGTPTSHTCSTFSSLEVCLSVWMLPLSTGRDLNTGRSALHSTCFRMYCQQSLHFKLFL